MTTGQHTEYDLTASELARLLTADLAELPTEILSNYVAPVARRQMRELDDRRRATPEVIARRRKAQWFWRRLDAYCEVEVRDRGAAAAEDASETLKASELQVGDGVKAEGAPAWSIIREVSVSGGSVIAVLDWGKLVYGATEDVVVLKAS